MRKNDKIPKLIHYCWFGGNELGEKEKLCIDSWKKKMPDYKILRWDESNYDINKNDFIKEAYKNKKWAFVSDYARLDIIYNYGGVYLDTDVEVIKKFDDLLENECFIGFESNDYVATGLGFGAKPKNLFIQKNMKEYENKVFDVNKTNCISCPKITTSVLKELGFKMNNTFQKNRLVTLYPKEYFCPKDYYSNKIKITNNTYSIHHYSMTWLSKRDIRWHKLSVILCNFFGKKIGNKVVLFFKAPGSIIINLKKIGLKNTINKYLRR